MSNISEDAFVQKLCSLHFATLCFMVKFNTNHQAVRSVQIIFGDLMTIDKLLLCSGNSTFWVIFNAQQKTKCKVIVRRRNTNWQNLEWGKNKYYLHSKMIVPFLRFLFFRESLFTLVCIQIPLSQNKITLQNNISPRKKQSWHWWVAVSHKMDL